ncbi:NUDIX domain-containing protein [Streptomyces sp. NPDC005070]
MAANENESKMVHPRMAAGALSFDVEGRVLMVEPTYKNYGDILGGYVETGESPLQAAGREVHEGLGSSRVPGRLLAVDWAPNGAEGGKVFVPARRRQAPAGNRAGDPPSGRGAEGHQVRPRVRSQIA